MPFSWPLPSSLLLESTGQLDNTDTLVYLLVSVSTKTLTEIKIEKESRGLRKSLIGPCLVYIRKINSGFVLALETLQR